MSRITFDSLGRKPLVGQSAIVLTTDYDFPKSNNYHIAYKIPQALKITKRLGCNVMVIGGAKICQLILDYITRMYINEMESKFKGNTCFPEVNWKRWHLIKTYSCQGFCQKIYKK